MLFYLHINFYLKAIRECSWKESSWHYKFDSIYAQKWNKQDQCLWIQREFGVGENY